MGCQALRKTPYAARDGLATKPDHALRLRFDLDGRHHALSPAEDRGRVTVATADPDNARLAEVSGGVARRHPKLRVCASSNPVPDELWTYAQALGALLGGHLGPTTSVGEVHALIRKAGRADCDLIIFGKDSQPLIRRLLTPSNAERVRSLQRNGVPFALLVAQEPLWPLERILLVLCGERSDNVAVDWALRLARPGTAAVTVLAVVPPVPAMYHGLSRMEQTLRSLLATNTALGGQMRQVSRRLVESKIDGTLRLRQGAPDQQVCCEIAKGDYDLVILATRPCRWWLRQFRGDPVCSLLSRVHRPVLFVEPTIA